ncbi:hypothetical protein CK203_002540 [Vitis vinifera]|uniref:Uncharacterized protein n=1 Tax=Vitis vinifera TaxID=29760 RepID=A0A438KH62_VITVI|nr:hypothetical protein CK203_002540 [Vitis vinifera]
MCHCLHLVHSPWRQHSWQQLPLTHQPLSERQQSRLRQTDSGTTTSLLGKLFSGLEISLPIHINHIDHFLCRTFLSPYRLIENVAFQQMH